MQVLYQASQVAALDELVLQARRVRRQVGVQQGHDPRVAAMLHDAIQHACLVAQHRHSGAIQTELQRDGRLAPQVRVPGLPHLTEAADAHQLFQFPVHPRQRTLSWLESWQAWRQEGHQFLGAGQRHGRRDGGAGGVGGTAQRTADCGGHLRQVGGEGLPDFEGLNGGLGLDGDIDLVMHLVGGRLGQGFQLRPQGILLAVLVVILEGVGGDVV